MFTLDREQQAIDNKYKALRGASEEDYAAHKEVAGE